MTSSKIVLGLWPIAGITTIGVTDKDARDTIATAIDHGITRFDTAYSYGFDGESDRRLGEFVRTDRERFEVFGKVGQRWNASRERIVDGSPHQLTQDAEESLKRSDLEYFDLLYLHSPDPDVEIEVSADALLQLQERGLTKRLGICNATWEQIERFDAAADCDAIQCPLNLCQRTSTDTLIRPAEESRMEVYVFWALMKGLLAGKITRDHVFQPGDSRPGYEIFQGETRRRIHDILDELSKVAAGLGKTVAQLSIGWTVSQPGVTAALIGARRPEQIIETAAATELDQATIAEIDRIVAAKA